MSEWIWTKTGGSVSEEGRQSLTSSGRARDTEFVRTEDYARGVGTPPVLDAPASRYRDRRSGGEVTAEARTELMGRGAKAGDFAPLDGPSAVQVEAPPLAVEPPPAPPPPPPAAAQYVDRRTGGVVSAAGMANLVAQGRAQPHDFDAADAPTPPVSKPPTPDADAPHPRRR